MENPDLVIEVPPVDPSVDLDEEFDLGDIAPPPEPLEEWRERLEEIVYDSTAMEITKVGVSGVKGQELGGKGWKTIHSVPEGSERMGDAIAIADSDARDAVKASLLEIAEELTVAAGYAAAYKHRLFSALVHHVRKKFLNDSSLGLADRQEVDYAWKMLNQVKDKVGSVPGLVAGMIEYADQ